MCEKEAHKQGAHSSASAADVILPVSYDAVRPSRGDSQGNRLGLRHRLLLRVAHLWFWLSRGMTLGVRAIVRNDAGHVFLVRHSYVPGWHLPGGGVEKGQTAREALETELREEANIRLDAEPLILGIYLNLSASKRDHVMLYLVDNARQTSPRLPDHEIVEAGFFAPDALPDSTTLGTRRRLAELDGEVCRSTYW